MKHFADHRSSPLHIRSALREYIKREYISQLKKRCQRVHRLKEMPEYQSATSEMPENVRLKANVRVKAAQSE